MDFLAILPILLVLFIVMLIMWRSIDTQLKIFLNQNMEIINRLNEKCKSKNSD